MSINVNRRRLIAPIQLSIVESELGAFFDAVFGEEDNMHEAFICCKVEEEVGLIAVVEEAGFISNI